MNPRRLYRSRRDRALFGVAGGLAEYLDVDVSLVRVLWLVSIFFGGFTLLLYFVMAIVVPNEPDPAWMRWQPPYQGWTPPAGPAPQAGQPAATGTSDGTTDAAAATGAEGEGSTQPGTPDATAPGWQPGQTYQSYPPYGAYQPAYQAPAKSGGGQGWLVLGVLFVLFGALALADQLIPGWGGAGHLWPAFILGVGALLLVGSFRRGATHD